MVEFNWRFLSVGLLVIWGATASNSYGLREPAPGRMRAQADNKSFLTAGDPVPRLEGHGVDGKPLSIDFATQGKPTVIYVIVPFTKYVVANEANFAAIVRAAGPKFKFVVLSTVEDRFVEYVTKARTEWGATQVTAISGISARLKQEMKLGGYPQTLVVSTDSKVIEDFMGAYDDHSISAKVAAVEKFFGTSLPGLR